MGENTIDWKTVNRKLKIERFKRKVKAAIKSFVDWVRRTVNAAVEWFSENKEFALVTLPILAGLATKGYKLAMVHREDVIRTRRFYDPRKGRYSTARRNLTSAELREIDERYAAGESYRAILDDMGVLK